MAKTNPTSRAHALATNDWRSRQPAHQGADGLPNARGRYVLRCIDGEWHLLGPGESSEAVGNDITTARARMEEAHAAYIAALPTPAVRQVYFIGSSAKIGLPVKIGVSDRPATRLRQLQTASPTPLSLLACVPGDEMDELRYHVRFREQHQHGEWFEINKRILREIERLGR